MGKTVNQTELAAIFGVSDVTVWEWQKDGLPMLARGPNGTSNQYDTEACIAWYTAREVSKVSKETHRDRLTRLQADALELDIAEKKNVLVPVDQVEPVWQARVFAAAAFLSGQPSRLAGILEATAGIEAKREVLRKEFNAFLTKLGVDGEAFQADVQRLLEKVSAQDAADLIARFTKGHDGSSDASITAGPRVAGDDPDPADPAVGVG